MSNTIFKSIICLSLSLAALGHAQLQRVPNTTLTNLPPQPPVFGYTVTNAFGTITFTNPIAIAVPPGETNRLFVVEQAGRIAVITNLAAPNRTTFLDYSAPVVADLPGGERGLLGLAFHPDYASNGFFYIFYTGNATTPVSGGTNSLHDILSRFKVSAANPNRADTNETRLIVQRDEAANHNGGDLHFGPDGYLYVGLGDEGGSADSWDNSQRIDKDFFSGILRLDVDKKPGSLAPNPHPASTTNYTVPPDNPFIGATNFIGSAVNSNSVRTEFWAVGLRNPWRFTFDPPTGALYCGDVGQNAREEVDLITKGGNYGWKYREGFIAGYGTPPSGFSALNPLLDYLHGSVTNKGFAVIGGLIHRGATLSQLQGSYIFADNGSGHIWRAVPNGTNAIPFDWLATEPGIAGFGVDPRNGDLLMANQSQDRIRRLIYNDTIVGAPLPPTLAATGAFTDLATLAPAPGLVPYDLNVPFWSDNAIKSRWFSLPNTNLTITFNATNNWSFPTGTVWMKHFELELTNGVPASRQRLETRFLVKNTNGVYGLTYRWTTPPTNALLVAEEGFDESFAIKDGGNLRTQVWHYPGRAECLVCHTPQGGYAIGFNTAQLNRDFDYGSGPTNQLAALSHAGYFNANLPSLNPLPALATATDESVSREYRVRSYLAANCVQCHQPGGSAQALWDARLATPTADAGLVNGPLLNNGGNPANRVLVPGSLANSAMLARLATFAPGHMPPLATSVINTQAVELLAAWITNDLPGYQTFADWQTAYFGDTNLPAATATADPDGDGDRNNFEFLLLTNPTNSLDSWNYQFAFSNDFVRLTFPHIANRGFEIQSVTQLALPLLWQPLDIPENAPRFYSSNYNATIDLPTTNAAELFRIRVFAP